MAPRAQRMDRASIPLIAAKCRVPSVSDRAVARPRLARLMADLAATHRPVALCATAGSGKTTAVVHALPALGLPAAWLTVDDTDAAPGRLLTYLEAALARRVPTVAGVATGALRRRAPHREAAGLLAEAIDEPIVLVVDELERLAAAPAALAVLSAFLRYAPASVRVVLVSRVELVLDARSSAPLGGEIALREEQLAFTVDEADAALGRWGRDGVDAASAVEVTAGWVTGVMFEAWRSTEHVAGLGGHADPLHGYLATQVLDQLTADERRFLVATSVLGEVSPRRAEALGQARPADMLDRLRAKHLPVTWADGAMRCHPRFREYLLSLLAARPRREVVAVHEAHGTLLEREGHHEEAVEEYLSVGSPERARHAAEAAIDGVVERLDFDVAERWLEALGPVARPGDDRFTRSRLMLAIARERYRTGAQIADELAALHTRHVLAARSPSAASMLAWCYFHVGRVEDMHAVLDEAEHRTELDAMFLLSLVERGVAPEIDPDLSGGPLDGLIIRVRYIQGRLREVAEAPSSPWAAAVTAPWRVGALRAMGETERALALYRADGTADWAPVWLHAIVAPELFADLGRLDDARAALARGRALIRQSGSIVFDMLNRLIEAKLWLWHVGDHEPAHRILRRLERRPEAARYGLVVEQIDAWMGMVHLLRSEDEAAALRLRRAVRGMRDMDRMLEVPAAAVLLAEAEWRLGRDDAADAAADWALDAARRHGSHHCLLRALEQFPAVAARRLDAERDVDGPWHEIGRALWSRGRSIPAERPHVSFHDLGEPALLVAGVTVRPRIRKSYELLAYLVAHADRPVERDELLTALFGGRDDVSTRSYLRQALRHLRDALPAAAELRFDDGRLRLADELALQVTSQQAEALVARALRIGGLERSEALRAAIAAFDRGEYLAGVESAWVGERRAEIAALACDARHEAAQAAYEAVRHREAEAWANEVLHADPYREATWRLLMRIAHAAGDEDRVIAVYRRCERTLRAVGAAPAQSTSALLTALRR